MIMNYVVRIKNLKVDRLKTFLNYLNNDKHKNHTKKNTEIYELSNRENFVKISNDKIIKNKMEYVKNGKGGRPLKVLGKSLTFNVPVDFDFDLEKAKLIYEDLIDGLMEIYQNLENDKYDIDRNEIYGILHGQENNHFHILTPYLDKDGKTIRDIKPKAFNARLKLLWNEIMHKHYGIDIERYQPREKEEQFKASNRRYLEELKAEYERVLKIGESRYYKNQLISVERLLKLNDSELENNQKVDTVENNFNNAQRISKSLNKVVRPPM